MGELGNLIERIVSRVEVHLRGFDFPVGSYVQGLIDPRKFTRFYAFYGITPHHPLHFQFIHSALAGSYFLGQCRVDHSILYKTDVRGDELKQKGDVYDYQGLPIPLYDDETIDITDSFLVKTLVHSHAHNPERPEDFFIANTVALPYANIHGSPMQGCFLGPFATVDRTTLHNCVIGHYAYVQTGHLAGQSIEPGTIWVSQPDQFDFHYRFDPEVLKTYVDIRPGQAPGGVIMDFVEARKEHFEQVFEMVQAQPLVCVSSGAFLSKYAVTRGHNVIGDNVLVAQRAHLEDARLGRGANAQEHCYILNSRLEGFNVTAHGGKVIQADLGERVFVGFNAFLRGRPESRLQVGPGCIVMPHTIIDLEEPLTIPPERLVWGFIRHQADLETNSIPLADLSRVSRRLTWGAMRFEGHGKLFVEGFKRRIDHILEANGAFYDGLKGLGHAQTGQKISYNIIQPYSEADLKGIYPSILINP